MRCGSSELLSGPRRRLGAQVLGHRLQGRGQGQYQAVVERRRHKLGAHREARGGEARGQLDEAAQVTGVDYVNAQRFRGEFQERKLAHLDGFDALIMPITLVTAPKLEESDRHLIILSQNWIPWSFIGFPALSV